MRSYRMASRKTIRLYVLIVVVGVVVLVLGTLEVVQAGSSGSGGLALYAIGFVVFVAGLVGIVVGTVLLRFRVVADDEGLTSYNVKGGKRRANRQDITAIVLRSKQWGTLTRPVEVRVPYVQLVDGAGFWLDPLAGTAITWPPRPEQLAMVGEIRDLLGMAGEIIITPPAD
jgi:hypothetical protein